MKRSIVMFTIIALASVPVCSRVQAAEGAGSAPSRMLSRESYRRANLAAAKENYLRVLKSDNSGLVISGLQQVTLMRHYVPDEDLENIQDAVNRLAVGGRTAEIRYKAYLSSLVFVSPELFRQESIWQSATPDELFDSLSDALHRTLAGRDGRKYVRPE